MRAIAARMGISRDTVARAIKSESPPRYQRVAGPSAFDAFEPLVRELLAQFPTMPASVIAERVGWAGSPSWRSVICGFRREGEDAAELLTALITHRRKSSLSGPGQR